MIPDPDVRERPPLTLELVVMLGLLAPLLHWLAIVVLVLIGFRGSVPVVGMAALLAYGGIFALCAARFARPPAQQLALVAPPAVIWVAVLFLVPALVLSSEIDNQVKALVPPPVLADPPPVEDPLPFRLPTIAIVLVAVLPAAYELFFRGVMQPLAVTRLGVVWGVAVTALLSAVASSATGGPAAPWAIAPQFALALVLGVLRQASGSLWPPLALHVLTGAVTFGAELRLFGIPGFDDIAAAHTPAPWLAGAALSTGIGLALCRAASRASQGPTAARQT
jgi:membrane protease YdiL (CAAX protease family)